VIAGPGPAASGRLLVSVAIAAALTPLNSTMIAVALPAISSEFGAAAATVTVSVITAYLIATIVFQMPAGSVADRLGYARALTVGRWMFAAGALLAVLAPTLTAVVGGRLLMAAGGALMVPTAMALLRVSVRPERRARAFGTMGAIMGGAAAIGPAIGGLMIAQAGWRMLFLVNIPLLALSAVLQGSSPAEGARASKRAAFDWPGTLLLGGALTAAIAATRTSPPAAYALGMMAVVLFAGLLAQERHAAAPILDLHLFTMRGFVAGAGVIALQNLAMYSLLVQVPFLFGGDAPARASSLSLAIVAMTATMAVSAPVGGRIAERLGIRSVVLAGGALGAAGIAGLALLDSEAPVIAVAARLLVIGLGLGLSMGPSQAGALSVVEASHSGMASAALSMLRYLGGIAGTVILSFALAGGESREYAALWIFAAAFGLSALSGIGLPASLRSEPAPTAFPEPQGRRL
jgi:MFS family permease